MVMKAGVMRSPPALTLSHEKWCKRSLVLVRGMRSISKEGRRGGDSGLGGGRRVAAKTTSAATRRACDIRE